ncbi:MAG: hypothetical protein IPL72_07720 [Sulfuritalea sp.]|nr:hypothetical protein [Sulfuritalea sp.]
MSSSIFAASGDGLAPFHDNPRKPRLLALVLGTGLDFGQAVLHAFPPSTQFALGVVEFALLLEEFGMRLLGFGDLSSPDARHF